LRILIVEDNEDDAVLAITNLEEGGLNPEYEIVDTREDYLKALDKGSWDIILSDYSLPNFTGFEALDLFIETGLDIPFILISGTIGEDLAVEAMRKGAHDYILKENLTRLVPAVTREIREAKIRREHKTSLETIINQAELMGNVLKSLTHPFYVINVEDYTIELANPAISKGNMPGGITCYELSHHRDEPCSGNDPCPMEEILRAKKPVTMEHLHFSDGEQRHVEVNGYPIFDDAGEVVQVIEYNIDVTDRKLAEEKLKKSERFLRESQEVANIGSYVLDIQAGLWESSKVLDDIFGIDEDFKRSIQGWSSIIHPDWQQIMGDYFTNDVIGNRGRFDKEYKIIRKNDGAERWVYGLGELELDERGNPIKMLGTIQDITIRKKLEEENLREKDEKIKAMEKHREYTFEVADRLRNPLQVLKGPLEIINTKGLPPEKKRGMIKDIHQSAKDIEKGLKKLT
jgi:PAS domain S-box-containing protein